MSLKDTFIILVEQIVNGFHSFQALEDDVQRQEEKEKELQEKYADLCQQLEQI